MAGTTELELKFAYTDDAHTRLLRAGFTSETASRSLPLWTIYYDTPNAALAKARVALRVRRTPEGFVQTVKGEGDVPFERFEFERPVASDTPERDALPPPNTHAGAIVRKHFEALRALFVTDFQRLSWRLQPNRSLVIELCVDVGHVSAELPHAQSAELGALPGPRHVKWPIREIEIERVTGSRLGFLWWALRFAARHQLTLLFPTKHELGLRLCGQLPRVAAPVKGPVTTLHRRQTIGQAAAAALRTDLTHLLANIDPLVQGDDPETVHQLRVGLRRMRSSIRFFDLITRELRWGEVDQRAQALASVAGQARDVDVFAAGLLQQVGKAFPSDAAMLAIGKAVGLARHDARERTRDALTHHAATAFALTVLYLCERLETHARPRRVRLAHTGTPAPIGEAAPASDLSTKASIALDSALQANAKASTLLEAPLAPYAAIQLQTLWLRLKKRLRKAKTPTDWHRARLAAKSLRYALELAMPVLPKQKTMQRVLKRLIAVQQRLGDEQDQAVAVTMAHRLAGQAHLTAEESARATALIEGWTARSATPAEILHGQARTLAAKLRKELESLV